MPDVKYYVSDDFLQSYPETTVSGRHKLQKMEYQVLQSYLRHLESTCVLRRSLALVLCSASCAHAATPPSTAQV